MKAAARRIVDEAETEARIFVVDDKFNALETPTAPLADIVPETWTPEHVGKRLVEAFETLAKLPPLRGPKVPGNSWPPYIYDRGDLNSQASLSEREKARRRQLRNSTPLRPTGEDIRRMEIALTWLSDLHAADEGLCRVVQEWARLRSKGTSIKDACRRAGLSFQAFYRQRDKGVAIIVERIAATPVW